MSVREERLLKVGADVEALCGKCGDVWHVVVAKVGDRVAKVQCKQCSAPVSLDPKETWGFAPGSVKFDFYLSNIK